MPRFLRCFHSVLPLGIAVISGAYALPVMSEGPDGSKEIKPEKAEISEADQVKKLSAEAVVLTPKSIAGTPSISDGKAYAEKPTIMFTPVVPEAPKALFSGGCGQGILENKLIPTDCSLTAEIKGEKVCFSSDTAKALFMESADSNLKKAKEMFEGMGARARANASTASGH